jgi:hypothetical protein
MASLGLQVAEGADVVVRKVALAADQVIVMATPVDEGRARSNWIAALDAAAVGTVEPYAEGAAAANGAIEQAARVIADYDGDVHSEIHLTNNLPYIGELNDGSSAQAPAGFVEKGVTAAVKAVGQGLELK